MKQFKSALPEIHLKYSSGVQRKVKITSSRSAYDIFKILYESDIIEYIECSYALFLNRASNTIGWMQLSRGGMCSTIIDPKILFAVALKCGASGIIVSHNHPSGNLKPSEDDRRLTRKLREAGKLLDIEVLDHLIVSVDSFYSFVDEGMF